uniref:Uncharacterized protein n=1 Tax=Nelumbo nucifera TaxID=4432 RepID=A0A822YHG1_NELNU|nr:TPA_asm: hypothetical protein HUJ06_009266 [Nelumbo nucifera]
MYYAVQAPRLQGLELTITGFFNSLPPSANDSDVKAQYQKLVTLLQPIKNKFTGTELALGLIKDAFSVLSDQEKRSAFNSKREAIWASLGSSNSDESSNHDIASYETVATAHSPCRYGTSSENSYRSREDGISKEMLLEMTRDLGLTLVDNCNVHDQQERNDLQGGSFSAHINAVRSGGKDRHAKSINFPMVLQSSSSHRHASLLSKALAPEGHNPAFRNSENSRKANSFEVSQILAVHYRANVPYRYAQINLKLEFELIVTWLKPVPVTEDEWRWYEAGLPVACGTFHLDPESSEKQVHEPMLFSHICSWDHGVIEEQFEIYPKGGEVLAVYKNWDLYEWSLNPENFQTCRFKVCWCTRCNPCED